MILQSAVRRWRLMVLLAGLFAAGLGASLAAGGGVPPAPTQLFTKSGSNTTSVTLQWQHDQAGITGFEVERRLGSEPFRRIATLSTESWSYDDIDLPADPDLLYTYRVRAIRGDVASAYSNEAEGSTALGVFARLTVTPRDIMSGSGATGTVHLDGPATAAGHLVVLATSHPTWVKMPTQVRVPGGALSVDFPITTAPLAGEKVDADISAWDGMLLDVVVVHLLPNPNLTGPSNLLVQERSPTSLSLSWHEVQLDVTEIERRSGNEPFRRIQTQPGNLGWFVDNDLAAGTEYTYRVRSVPREDPPTDYSNEASGRTPPPGLEALTLSPHEVRGGETAVGMLALEAMAPADGLPVILTCSHPILLELPDRITVPGSTRSVTFAATPASVTKKTVVTLTVRSGVESVQALLVVIPDPPPHAPSGLEVSAVSQTELALRWTDNSTDETGFEVERRSGQEAFQRISTVRANVTTITNTGLAPGTPYTYRVRAVNAAGVSAYSNEATASTRSPVLTAFTLSPTLLRGGLPVTGTLSIDNAAPAGGLDVTLSSSRPDVTATPAHVTLAAGSTTARFMVGTTAVEEASEVSVTASYAGVTRTIRLRLLTEPKGAVPERYWITDLGTFGGMNSSATGINNAGEVVGTAQRGGADYAFLYRDGALLDLGWVRPYGVNSAGHVVGFAQAENQWARRPFLFDDTGMHDLGTLGDGESTIAYDINDTDQVVGSAQINGVGTHAFLWSAGVMQDLGTLGGTESVAYGINPNGQIVGYSYLDLHGPFHAFLHDDNHMRDIGTLGGRNSVANGINAAGQVVGHSEVATAVSHAFLYNGDQMYDLGTLGGLQSAASGINALGQIVGSSDPAAGDDGVFLWENGRMEALSDRIPGGAGWKLHSPVGITDRGLIACSGYNTDVGDRQQRALLLTPYSVAPPPLPDAPTSLTAVAPGGGGLDLAWTDVSATETSFEIERRTGSGAWSRIAMLPPNTTAYRDTGRDPETRHTYRVRAVNAAGNSAWSGETAEEPLPPQVAALLLSPNPARAGAAVTGTVTLGDPAPPGGAIVVLSQAGAGVTLPASVTVAAGQTRAVFAVETVREAVGPILITASYRGGSSVATLALRPGGPAEEAGAVYWIQDLGQREDRYSRAHGINAAGHVAGVRGVGDAGHTAFRFDGMERRDLGAFGSGGSSGHDVNAAGQVIGYSATADSRNIRAFLFDATGMHDLGVLPGGTDSAARAINAAGQVVGESSQGGNGAQHAFLFQDGGMRDLGTLGGATSHALDINDAGVVVGGAQDSAGNHRAFLFDGARMRNLGTLGGDHSGASAINAAGQVAGWSTTSGNDLARAFLWESAGMRALDTLGGANFPLGMNAVAQIVGHATFNATDERAVLWDEHGVHDLNRLVPPSYGFHLKRAVAINDAGQIACTGVSSHDGRERALLLTPLSMALPPPPAAPIRLGKIGYSTTTIQLGWEDNSGDETAFEVEWKSGDGAFTRVDTIDAALGIGSIVRSRNLTIPTTADLVHVFRVRAVNAAGGSAYSNEIRGTTAELLQATAAWVALTPNPATGGEPVLGKVTLNGVAPVGGAVVTLSTESPDAATFPDRVTVPAGESAVTFTMNTRAVTIPTTIRIQATFTGASQEQMLTLLPLEPPAAPTILVVSDTTATEIALAWIDNSTKESGFEIERRGPGGDWVSISTTRPDATGFRDTGLTGSTHYTYRVRAVNAAGSSAWSNEAGGTTAAGAPGVTIGIRSLSLPESLGFGEQPVGTGSAVKSITLTNSGTAPLVVSSVTLAGKHAAEFALVSDSGESTLAPGATRTFALRFTPAVAGAREASMVIQDNAPGSPHTVALGGVGVAPIETHPVLPAVREGRIAVFRPSTREWFFRGRDGDATVIQFGGPGDVPVPEDYLGLGSPQIAVFRPSTREWFLRDPAGATIPVPFGGPDDIPVPGDYLGLGRAQIAVFRTATQEWFVRRDDGSAVKVQFGGPGDVPVPADYFGFGRAQIAVFRPATGEWFLRTDEGGTVPIPWGTVGDLPVSGDYLGLGRAQIAVYRPSTREWFLRTDGGEAIVCGFGGSGDLPMPADYFGAGRQQIGVYRPGSGEWFLRTDLGESVLVPWGGPGDVPLAGP